MTTLTRETLELLNHATPFALAMIIGHQGSPPRTSGSSMLVRVQNKANQ